MWFFTTQYTGGKDWFLPSSRSAKYGKPICEKVRVGPRKRRFAEQKSEGTEQYNQ